MQEHNVQIRLIIENNNADQEVYLIYKQNKLSFFPQIGSSLSTGHVSAKVTRVSHVLDTQWNMIICRLDGPVRDLKEFSDMATQEGWILTNVGNITDNFR